MPHELALLVSMYLARKRYRTSWQEWKWMICTEVTAKRTHNFVVTTVKSKTFLYRCACEASHELTIRRHNKVLRGEKTNIYVRKCWSIETRGFLSLRQKSDSCASKFEMCA
ncbi:hypothetical protein J4727_10035 [Providencia rettgeri]|uniref:Uncharacterized protein n=1 Tax=Providencia rettgeri TaxID=587 RepID=A0A939NFI0_PRORE|nr:hypothetical protein [Providencia rettgeri]